MHGYLAEVSCIRAIISRATYARLCCTLRLAIWRVGASPSSSWSAAPALTAGAGGAGGGAGAAGAGGAAGAAGGRVLIDGAGGAAGAGGAIGAGGAVGGAADDNVLWIPSGGLNTLEAEEMAAADAASSSSLCFLAAA